MEKGTNIRYLLASFKNVTKNVPTTSGYQRLLSDISIPPQKEYRLQCSLARILCKIRKTENVAKFEFFSTLLIIGLCLGYLLKENN